MKKRTIAALLCLCMAASLLGGCGGKEAEKSGGDGGQAGEAAKGKYVEEIISLPAKSGEEAVSLAADAERNLELYTVSAKGEPKKYVCSGGGDWKEETAGWLGAIEGASPVKVVIGEDHSRYALMKDDGGRLHVLKEGDSADEGTEIALPDFEKQQKEKKFYDFGTDMRVLADGSIVLAGLEEVRIYDQKDGSVRGKISITKTSTDELAPMAANGDQLLVRNQEMTGFDVYDSSGEKTASMGGKAEIEASAVFLSEGGDAFYMSERGLSHLAPQAAVEETLMDGGGTLMDSQTAFIKDAVKTGDTEYYVLYQNNDKSNTLAKYCYDSEAKLVGDETLTVYSLEENATVRQAITVFKREHPDVNVEYNTGAGGDSSATTADSLRALNTELLNKKGADVLLLDGLPADSLIEKGVLADMSDLIEPYVKDKSIPAYMLTPYEKNGGLYGVPVRYGIPVTIGNEEMIKALESLDSLEAYVKKHPDKAVFTWGSFGRFVKYMVNAYCGELFADDGKLREEKLVQCLSLAETLSGRDGVTAPDYGGQSEDDSAAADLSDWTIGNVAILKPEESVSAVELLGLNDMMRPCTVMREGKYELHSVGGYYVPHGIAAINSASGQEELAEAFVETLLSGEVQGQDLGDGFPCNRKAEQSYIDASPATMEEAEDGLLLMVGDEDGNTVSAAMPLKDEVEDLFAFAEGLKTPAAVDEVILEMILEEAKKYHAGNETAGEAARKIINKTDTYLSE